MSPSLRLLVLTPIAALLVAACGGGGGSSATTTLTLSGTAATGRAIAAAAVSAKCAAGSGTATTGADGSFTIEIAGGSLPCVLRVAPASGDALHSLANGSGTTATVNITPLTELITAQAAGGTPAALFDNFDVAAQAKAGADVVQAAVQAVARALQGAIDLTGINPITDPLVVASGSTAGNALDQKLDALQVQLDTVGLTLSQLSEAIVTGGSALAAVQTVMQPGAEGCASLRSGRYVSLSVSGNEDGPLFYNFDAATLKATWSEQGMEPVTLTKLGECRYETVDDNHHEVFVSKSGIQVTLSTRTDPTSPVFGKTDASLDIPLQTIPLADLAGTWNGLENFRDPINNVFEYTTARWTLTLDAAGKLTAATVCDAGQSCEQIDVQGYSLAVHADGGFELIGSDDPKNSRVFAFRSVDGQLTLYWMHSGGRGMVVLAKQAPLTLPAVNETTNFWDVAFGGDGYAVAPLADVSTTVTAIDASAATYTLQRTPGDSINAFNINQPTAGLGAGLVDSRELVAMPLPGTGITAYVGTTSPTLFGLSVTKP